MSKNIKDYIHYYIGCRVEKDSWAIEYPTIKGVQGDCVLISEYDYQTPNAHGTFKRPELWHQADLTKPILRRLEDMTEEEMVGLLQSMVPEHMEVKPSKDDYQLEMFYNDNGLMVDSDVAVGANYSCICYEG